MTNDRRQIARRFVGVRTVLRRFSVVATVPYVPQYGATIRLTRSCSSSATQNPSRHRVAAFSVTETELATVPV